jgi:hypothetical protein
MEFGLDKTLPPKRALIYARSTFTNTFVKQVSAGRTESVFRTFAYGNIAYILKDASWRR